MSVVLAGGIGLLLIGVFLSIVANEPKGEEVVLHRGRTYSVRKDVDDPISAAETLDALRERLLLLLQHLDPTNPYHQTLMRKIPETRLRENLQRVPDASLTSYSVNKGEEIVMCLRDPRTKRLYDLDTLTYVIIHEAAHVACPETGHTPLFRDIFADLLSIAVHKARILRHTDFVASPKEYCGVVITERVIPSL